MTNTFKILIVQHKGKTET